MRLLNKYIFKTISGTFFPIFLSLYAITSVIYLIKIASLTSIITIDFFELVYLYLLTMPMILFYTLAITFFISMIINFSKLSSEYELIVLTSFGQSPLKLIKLILPISFLFSLALFIISFILIPQAKFLNKSFIVAKKQEAQFNIKPSEYGQSFGPWYIYVKDKIDGLYHDIILFQPTQNQDIFLKADTASITNQNQILQLKLTNGSAYNIGVPFQQIDYKEMLLNNKIENIKKLTSINDIITYWEGVKDNKLLRENFIKNVQFSLLPLVSVFFYLAFGYFNPRYDKNRATLYGLGLAVLYIVIGGNIAETKQIELSLVLPTLWILLSIFIYRKRVMPYY